MFDSIYKLAASNRRTPDFQGFRFHNDHVLATNIVTSLMLHDERVKGLDCYVNSAQFIAGYKNAKTPNLQQQPDSLLLKDGNYEIEIPLLNKDLFPDLDAPEGKSSPADKFLDAVKVLKPMLRNSKDVDCAGLLYIVNGYMHYTDGNLLMRTPTTALLDEPVILTKEFLDLVVESKIAFTEVMNSGDTFSILCKEGWIHTHQHVDKPPLDFAVFCQPLDELEIPGVDENLHRDLNRMCSTDTDGILECSGNEIIIDGKTRARIRVDVAFDGKVKLHSRSLKKVLAFADCIDFNYHKTMIAFRGPNVEGFLGTS